MNVSNLFLRCGVLALILGIGLGMWMGGMGAFELRPVHAHANLAGWATLMIFGFFYRLFPDAAVHWSARLHAVLSIFGTVLMLGGMIAMVEGSGPGLMVMIVGELIYALGVLVFVFILFGATARSAAS